MKNITLSELTESQTVAYNKLSVFLNEPITRDINSRVAVLVGKAGTGKTTLIRLVLDDLLVRDREQDRDTDFSQLLGGGSYKRKAINNFNFDTPSVFGVTLAHKAKNVLRHSIHFVNTFASYFGMKEHYDESGKLIFIKDDYKQSRSDCKLPHVVAVHDECSMYDADMLKTVLEDTREGVKIIFMGDPGQLPPITSEGDDDSPVFTKFKNVFHLTERVRQTEGNPIVDLSDIIYEQIFREIPSNQVDDRIKIVLQALSEPRISNDIGFTHLRYKEFLAHYKASSENYLDSKVIAYRRSKVADFNINIRNYLHGNPHSAFIPGEIIYMNETYYSDKDDTEVGKQKWVCYNSDEYKIASVTKGSNIQNVDCDLLYVEKTGHNHLAGIESPYIPIVSDKGQSEFKSISFMRKRAALTADSYKRASKWKYYYDFTNLFGNVSYGYCYTAHKAQGSGFKTVYIDINDILRIGPISTKRKLQAIYTALTRASHLAIFLKSN